MEHLVFMLMFLTEFEPVVQSQKYYLTQQKKSWTDAQTYCRTYYKDLATIASNADILKLQIEAQKQQFSSNAWIGMYNDINSWRWSFGNQPPGPSTFWEPGQPDNSKNAESCALTTLGTWYDVSCSLLRNFLCFDGNKTGTDQFVYYTNTLTWSGAHSYCRQFHTDLAIIRDINEVSFINQLTGGMKAWIGLFRDTWKWSDQTIFTTIGWAAGKPDNALKNENCVLINNGLATDAQCSVIQPFFCERGAGRRQIIRFIVQSDLQINDPTLKAAILNQIQQKLVEIGMMVTDIRVIFREQPDAVFQKMSESNVTVIKCNINIF